jgi:hypothetical protein
MDLKDQKASGYDLVGLRKIMKYTGKDSQSLDKNSNLEHLSDK